MLRGEIDPWMFHESNLPAYDGVHTLLGDLLDRALAKYGGIFVLPVKSPTLTDLGGLTPDRLKINAAGVRAAFVPELRSMRNSAPDSAVVPVPGRVSGSVGG